MNEDLGLRYAERVGWLESALKWLGERDPEAAHELAAYRAAFADVLADYSVTPREP